MMSVLQKLQLQKTVAECTGKLRNSISNIAERLSVQKQLREAVAELKGVVLAEKVSKLTNGTVSPEEVLQQQETLKTWADNLDFDAPKQSREEIFAKHDNTPVAMATLPSEYLQYFTDKIEDPRVYCSEAYFVDHAVNRHKDEIAPNEYKNIQEIILNPDEVIRDTRADQSGGNRDNLLFVKRYDKNRLVTVKLDQGEDGKLIFHKSLMPTKEKPYPGLPRIRPASVDGVPTISHSNNSEPGGSLSARDASNKIGPDGKEVKMTPLYDRLIAGEFNSLAPIAFMAKLKEVAKEIGEDVTKLHDPTIEYLRIHEAEIF